MMMQWDPHGLYGNPNPDPINGTWQGHVDKYIELQEKLRLKIAFAKGEGCDVDPEDEKWANDPPPARPFSG